MRYLPPITCIALLALTALAAQAPRAVSPAIAGGTALVDSPCPTFIWTPVAGALGYEVVVYGIEDGAPVGHPVLRAVLPAGASAWVPSADRCLAPGETYAWVVRGRDRRAEGEWSEASLFAVPERPSADELEAALEVVRRHLAAEGEPTEPRSRQPALQMPVAATVAAPGGDEPAELATRSTGSLLFRVDGSGNVNASKLVVGSSASTTLRALFADSDWASAPVTIGSRGGQSDVGAALKLDSSTSDGGRSFSLISTAAGAAIAGGKLPVWDDTGGKYQLAIDGVNDLVKVRNLALTQNVTSTFASGETLSISCPADEYLTGGGCGCNIGLFAGRLAASHPSNSTTWQCVCEEATGLFAYAVCLKSTPP